VSFYERVCLLIVVIAALWSPWGCQRERAEAPPVAVAVPAEAPLAFEERVTGGARPEDALPLIVAVHGLGDRPEGFVRLLEGLDFPARVVAPRGVEAVGEGYGWFPRSNPPGDFDGLAGPVGASAERLVGLIAWLRAKRPTRGPVVITGFSQGGVLSFAVAARGPGVVDLALPLAGYPVAGLRGEAKAMAPVCAFHGDADARIPYGPTAEAVRSWEASGAPVRLKTYAGVGHTLPASLRADWFAALRVAVVEGAPARACGQ
jgi:predicted esterase